MLKDLLSKNPSARKIFGKKEIGIILKQLNGISLTQSEKNRLSRDIRPKLAFIREISQFKDEFALKKGQETKKIVSKAVELMLQDKLKVKAILLFGSHAKGIVTPRSDIDICAVFDKISRREAGKFRVRILGSFPLKVDIQVFNVLPQKIKREIARNHKILFKTKEFDNISFTAKYS